MPPCGATLTDEDADAEATTFVTVAVTVAVTVDMIKSETAGTNSTWVAGGTFLVCHNRQ